MNKSKFDVPLALVLTLGVCGCDESAADYSVPERWMPKKVGKLDWYPGAYNEGLWAVGGKAFDGERKVYDETAGGLEMFKDFSVNYTARRQIFTKVKGDFRKPVYDENEGVRKGYKLKDIFGEDTVVWKALNERHRPDQPFKISNQDTRPPWFMLGDYEGDREDYLKWKAKNPNFLGFCILDEIDSDSYFYRTLFPDLQKADPELAAKINATYPVHRGQYDYVPLLQIVRDRQVKHYFGETNVWGCCSGYYSLCHMFGHVGVAGITYEATGQGCARWQVSGAFVRGAARQYQLPFEWYQAHFLTTYKRGEYDRQVCFDNHSAKDIDCNGGPYRGLSDSLFERQTLYGWLIGSAYSQVEDWPNQFSEPGEDGVRRVTEAARAYNRVYLLSQSVDRGVVYSPVALMVPFTDRYGCWGHSECIVDDFSQHAFFSTLVPIKSDICQTLLHRKGGEGCLFNSEFGEFYDVVNVDSGMETTKLVASLEGYKAAFLVGTYRRGDVDAKALERFVTDGGVLFVSADQVADGHVSEALAGVSFADKATVKAGRKVFRAGTEVLSLENPYVWRAGRATGAKPYLKDENGGVAAYANRFGRGRVVTVAAEKMRPWPELEKEAVNKGEKTYELIQYLLRGVQASTMPCEVTGDVQWGVNKTAKGWLVWLINNKGITHYSGEKATVDASKAAKVRVRMKDGSGKVFEETVPAGGYRLIEVAE